MAHGDGWTTEGDNELEDLWMEGRSDKQIAEITGRTVFAIACRRNLLGLTNAQREKPMFNQDNIIFPRFENVTKSEAAAIRRGAPPSARISKPDRHGASSSMDMTIYT